MATGDKKAKAEPAPKKEPAPAPTKEPASKVKSDPSKDKSASDVTPAKAESSETPAAAPANYSRGEGQKPVTQAYKDNWDAIFAKKKKK